MDQISAPPNGSSVDTDGGSISNPWGTWFVILYYLVQGLTSSGTTVNRPKNKIFVGRFYYDTTLSKPIWFDGTIWRDAAGAPA